MQSCSNCQKLRRKIAALESAMECMERELETYRNLKRFIEGIIEEREAAKGVRDD